MNRPDHPELEAARAANSSGPLPGRPSRIRQRVLTASSALLSRTVRPLWYAESLVLSARYQQFLASAGWARDSVRYGDRNRLWEKAAEPRLRQAKATVLEFGVGDGDATRWWSGRGVPFAAWHGFDTFEGLPADWVRGEVPVMSAGMFTPRAGIGAVPRLEAPFPFEWHRGLIEETLPRFSRPDSLLFVLVDVDLLEPTCAILDWLGRHGRSGDLVYFDEALDPWNEGLGIRRAIADGLALRALGHTGASLLVCLAS